VISALLGKSLREMIYVSENAALSTTLWELKLEQLERGYDLARKNANCIFYATQGEV